MAYGLYVLGGGLEGHGWLLPGSDIRGARLGIAARQLLLQLQPAEAPPMERDPYDDWHCITAPAPAERKVIWRLVDQGLIWRVRRYHERGANAYDLCLALTPLGADVLAVYGDAMRRGQRIRWERWDHPSVACAPERWQPFLDDLVERGIVKKVEDLNELGLSRSAINHYLDIRGDYREGRVKYQPCRQYGNSQTYLCRRIATEDSRWGDVILFPVDSAAYATRDERDKAIRDQEIKEGLSRYGFAPPSEA